MFLLVFYKDYDKRGSDAKQNTKTKELLMKKLSVISLLSLSMLFNAHMAQAESERALSEKVKAFCAEVTPGAAYKITLDQAYQILKKIRLQSGR